MTSSYQVTSLSDGDVFTSSRAMKRLARIDAVVFDCDGTLIDVHASYDAAVVKTAFSLTNDFFGKTPLVEEIGRELIEKIRRTGGFNSDWDVTYAIALFCAAALDGQEPKGEGKGEGKGEDGKAHSATGRLRLIVADFASKERLLGWESVDQYISSSGFETESVKGLRTYLGYPGNPATSRLAATFDQTYYGGDLYRHAYGMEPEVNLGKGLIDRERVIVTGESLSAISKIIGERRIAMATGRPFLAVEHTLGPLLGYFDREASVYIGDSEIFPELAAGLSKFRKPSGESLILARSRFSSKVLLYVGDSAEDRLMVENAGAPDGSIMFAGIYGTSVGDKEQISYFTRSGSDLVVKDVNQIPRLLEMARS